MQSTPRKHSLSLTGPPQSVRAANTSASLLRGSLPGSSYAARKSQSDKPTRNCAAEAFARLQAEEAEAERRDKTEVSRHVQRTDLSVWIAKQSSNPPLPAGRMAIREEFVQEPSRPHLRKTALSPEKNRGQSSLTYNSPILGANSGPTKSTPMKSLVPQPPPHLAVEEEREKRLRQEKAEFSLGSRSVPRRSLAPMSVQGRARISPMKAPMEDVLFFSSDDETPALPAWGRKTLVRPGNNAARIHLSPVLGKLTKATRKLDVGDRLTNSSRKARKRDTVEFFSEESDDGVAIELTDSSTSSSIGELLDAFAALTLNITRLQQHHRLPFLLRNLRTGFESRCQRFRVSMRLEKFPRHPLEVVYRYAIQESESDNLDVEPKYQEFIRPLTSWNCPLCKLHRPFRNKAMLVYHLKKDHVETKVSWTEMISEHNKIWKLYLTLPNVDELGYNTSVESLEGSEDEKEDVLVNEDVLLNLTNRELEEDSKPDPGSLPGSNEDIAPSVTRMTPLLKNAELEDVKPMPIKGRSSPKPLGGRPGLETAPRRSYRGSLSSRYPSPPPPDDPLGPAAQYPYLPEINGEEKVYSCRIGGPRVFDLLNTLPINERVGIMAWEIVHREEELFEMEDVRDEDKVMLALWNRYIILNRRDFSKNDYYDGLIKFVNNHWEVIHLAAGWRALRAFLIMLCMNRYIKFEQILNALKHYEEKTGMNLWYID